MYWAFTIIAIALLFFVLLLFLPITINLVFEHQSGDTKGNLTASIFRGLIKKKWDIPAIKMDEESFSLVYEQKSANDVSDHETNEKDEVKKETLSDFKQQVHQSKELMQRVVDVTTIMRRFLNGVHIQLFRWKSKIGTGDAALTGTLTGMVWAGKANVFAIVSGLMRAHKNPEFQVEPLFQSAVFQTKLECIMSFRFGNAIRAMIQVLLHARGTKKKKDQNRYVSKGA